MQRVPDVLTRFQRFGVFRFTRNPMYAGIDVTMIAAVLYTGNPALLAVGAFVIAVQHRIIRAEERWLLETFGSEYVHYQERVGRYVTLPLALRSRVQAFVTLLRMGHCAPTVMSSMLSTCGHKADWLIRLASALPGGIGNTGGECGGITSPLVLLGLVHDLDSAGGGLPRVFDRSCNHIERFRRCHGSVLCHEIRRQQNQILPCIKAVTNSGGICAHTVCCESPDILAGEKREAYSRLYAAFDRCGFHCARTVLRSLSGLIPEEQLLLKASSAFLGGTSFAGMTCSALTAGAMALGLGMGDIERSPWRVLRMVYFIFTGGPAFEDGVNRFNGAMNRGNELAAWFTAQYGSTQCRTITRADFASREDVDAYIQGDGITRCRGIAESVAERVRIMLGETSTAKEFRAGAARSRSDSYRRRTAREAVQCQS
jgi:hypothetical protein